MTPLRVDLLRMGNPLKGLHDKLLADKPDGAAHNEDACPLCALESFDNDEGITFDDQPEGGSMSENTKTYTEDELKAAVDKAVADATTELTAKLSELENSHQQSEIDKAVAAAKAQSGESIKELQSKLDAAVLEAQTEKQAREELETSIATEKQAAQEAAELEARMTERLEKVKEVASFPDDYLNENADRWARMSDEEFEKTVADWKVIAAKSVSDIPKVTAMTASREESGTNNQSALKDLGYLRKNLVGKNL